MKEAIERVVNAWWRHISEVSILDEDRPDLPNLDLDGDELLLDKFIHKDVVEYIEELEKTCNEAIDKLLELDTYDFQDRLRTEFPEYTFIYDGNYWIIVQDIS